MVVLPFFANGFGWQGFPIFFLPISCTIVTELLAYTLLLMYTQKKKSNELKSHAPVGQLKSPRREIFPSIIWLSYHLVLLRSFQFRLKDVGQHLCLTESIDQYNDARFFSLMFRMKIFFNSYFNVSNSYQGENGLRSLQMIFLKESESVACISNIQSANSKWSADCSP